MRFIIALQDSNLEGITIYQEKHWLKAIIHLLYYPAMERVPVEDVYRRYMFLAIIRQL